ncbi:Uncharacterised protein [Chlamydia trachomatis]|nr:Uncharacterised protein [Chlamydia trachomatis]
MNLILFIGNIIVLVLCTIDFLVCICTMGKKQVIISRVRFGLKKNKRKKKKRNFIIATI